MSKRKPKPKAKSKPRPQPKTVDEALRQGVERAKEREAKPQDGEDSDALLRQGNERAKRALRGEDSDLRKKP